MSSIKRTGCFISACCLAVVVHSCTVTKQINKQTTHILLHDSVIKTGHVGISIYEPATGKYWYNYNADKYFVPASNVKLFTLYAGMKYLGDSIAAARFSVYKDDIYIAPAGDPTFLHPDFDNQPLLHLLQTKGNRIFVLHLSDVAPLGYGWAWDDYDQGYMVERNDFPIYGNRIWLSTKPIMPKKLPKDTLIDTVKQLGNQWLYIKPKYFADKVFRAATALKNQREKADNKFYTGEVADIKTIPFITNKDLTTHQILESLLHKTVSMGENYIMPYTTLYSQPTDALLKPMMHRSNNFFAEQTLLMAGNEKLGYMSEAAIIDTLLATHLKDIPQRPRWVDGSGLSRYNLFTPQDFVFILNKLQKEFGLARLQNILPTGNTGTLKNYFIADSGFIYAKTGTLSNHVALSGYMLTRKNKWLFFSILNNNFNGSASPVRRAVERFIQYIRERY